ncbi:Actin-related protein 4 [Babesia microti strain RI]|uniref:Actin-related protein 4 n=1 Tax=Babesia microti (strain RI) TaxID=1133968 RepID=A0A1R4AA09_BABMR|nr:Actin-related protein 4 [Babesia microti strain RI]SJK85805.1 Actin-related protein 4 [Babesia microti strain RI]|eukprot:XP_021338024.1 Actin-related protein 4 [Babesia microti strain RI]
MWCVSMYFGDTYVGAIVADVGASTIKYGQYGKDTPDAIIPSYLLQIDNEYHLLEFQNGALNVNNQSAAVNRLVWGTDQLEFNANSVCKSLNLIDSKLSCLDSINCESNASELSNKPLMLCEPNVDCKHYRENFTEVLFENYGSPGVYFSKSAVLSAFSTGRLTALIIDLGARLNSLAAVSNGRLLTGNSVVESCVSGNYLDFCFANMVLDGNCEDLLNHNLVAKGYDQAILSNCHNNGNQLHNVYVHGLVKELRETLCGVSQIKPNYNSSIEGLNIKKLSNITHTLPDGTNIDVTNLTYSVGELIFTDSTELMREFGISDPNGHTYKGLHTQIVDFVNYQIEDLYRRDLIANIFITGGLTSTTGLQERLVNEMSSFIPNDETVMMWTRLKISSPPRNSERSFSSWLGGSILASMPSFHDMWISRQEYCEHGSLVAHLKQF